MAGDRYDRFLGAAAGAAIGAVHGAAGSGPTEELAWLRRLFGGLAGHGRLELDWLATEFRAWLADAKRATPLQLAAGEALARGASPSEAGRIAMETANEPLGGSACLLTAIPIGLLHVGELRGVADDAAAAARLTHVDARAVAGCRAYSMALALVVRGQLDEVIERASLMASPAPSVREAVERSPDSLLTAIEISAGDTPSAIELAFGAWGKPLGLEEALAAVRAHEAHGPRVGALTGALVGGKLGWDALPASLRATPAAEEAVTLAKELWRRIFPGSGK